MSTLPADRRQLVARLRAELARHAGPAGGRAGAGLRFGVEAVDRVLPDGLAQDAVHELCGPEAASLGLAAVLLGRFAASGPVVWIRPRGDLYAPGLAGLGLAPERLIVVRAGPRDARLWALEETLRTPGIAAGVAEIDRLGLTQGRRLQLAAETGGTTALLVRPAAALDRPSVAVTRWRVAPCVRGRNGAVLRPGVEVGPPCWHLELVRCRRGGTGTWTIAWLNGGFHEVADPFPVAAPPLDRPARVRPA